jgi:protein involved in plasmid replication-relaxation
MDVAAPIKSRAKLFQRTEDPRSMELTERDVALLAHVSRHRFLSSTQLALLDGGSAQGVLRCLRSLYDHGYLDRPKSQLATMHDQGPQPFVYGLGQKGARALREYGNRIDSRVDWSEKNKRAGAIFLAHTLEIADFMVSLELACRANGKITLIREEEIIATAPDETRSAREPLRWEAVSVEQGRRERWTVVPDGLFGLVFPNETAAYFLLELDRGTIPISRSGEDHRSIRRKLRTYYDGWRAERHLEQFGVKQMRVLTITSSQERMHNMVGAVRSITEGRGSNFFLFVDRETLAASGPLSVEWMSGKGERLRLTD